LADYLEGLSQYNIPEQLLASNLRPGFGVIDVALSLGVGQRRPSTQLATTITMLLQPRQADSARREPTATQRPRPANIKVPQAGSSMLPSPGITPTTAALTATAAIDLNSSGATQTSGLPTPTSPHFPQDVIEIDWDRTKKARAKQLEKDWKLPLFSHNSHLTYVEHGIWQGGDHNCGVYRHIPPVQRGQFQEREVICGFRFVVG
jgi:hypothetical protein